METDIECDDWLRLSDEQVINVQRSTLADPNCLPSPRSPRRPSTVVDLEDAYALAFPLVLETAPSLKRPPEGNSRNHLRKLGCIMVHVVTRI